LAIGASVQSRLVTSNALWRTMRYFEEWLTETDTTHGLSLDCAWALLGGREAFLDQPDPTRWKSGDLNALLLELAVTRLTDWCGLADNGVPVMRAFLRFLDETGRLHPASATPRALRKELDRLAAKYPAAIADASRYRMAKRLFTAMLSDGVDIGDPVAVDRWLDDFSARSGPDRVPVLGELLRADPRLVTARFAASNGVIAALPADAEVPPEFRQSAATAPEEEDSPTYPPVRLPETAELADASRRSVLLSRCIQLAQWIGDGRPVTRHGELIPADVRAAADALGLDQPARQQRRLDDVPQLHNAWLLGHEMELLQLRRASVQTGARFAAYGKTADGVLELWGDMFDCIVADGHRSPSTGAPGVKAMRDWVMRWPAHGLGLLYRLQRQATVAELFGGLVEERAWDIPSYASDIAIGLAGLALRSVLGQLAEHEAVTVTFDADSPVVIDLGETEALAALELPLWAPDPTATVELTPLGYYGVRRNLLAGGVEAPALTAA
jgi:hypothetical protein